MIANKHGAFIASCVDIANILESRLKIKMIKQEKQKAYEVCTLQRTTIIVYYQNTYKLN